MSKELIANNYETSPTFSGNDWLANMPEEIRKAESLGKFKDVSSLAQSYLEAEKSLNQRVAVPKDDSSDEEWHKFYSRLGLPEDKRYTDKRSKEDEEYLTRYEDMFYQSGLLKYFLRCSLLKSGNPYKANFSSSERIASLSFFIMAIM
ncbi:hypothetical protein [Candidatus Tisiphia endosymbiont of Hybos culiciformis]|uniref:hypothetical protein n=1 Tax=Candidatus Tisiphia endosymbiont of Hybos culiciformis TaxID=3139331 RepID=UPI003CCADB7B